MAELSKRDFIKAASLLAGSALFAGCAPEGSKNIVNNLGELEPTLPMAESEVKIQLGQEKSVNLPLNWVPDTRTSYIKAEDGFRYYFSAGAGGYFSSGESLTELGVPQKYTEPSFRQGKFGVNCYRSPGTVFDDKEGNLWSVEHFEEWVSRESGNNFTARISLSESTDGGENWRDCGVILDGQASRPAGERVTGAGQPSSILRQEDGVQYVYTYFTDWGVGADSIHMARVPLKQITNGDAWQKYYKGEFVSSGKSGSSSPVILPPPEGVYAALASVSFNKAIGKYMAVFESGNGFWLTTSRDGIAWGRYQEIARFPERFDKRRAGSNWFSYPTLLSQNTGDQFVTSEKGVLIYSKGVYGKTPHQMKFREFNIT